MSSGSYSQVRARCPFFKRMEHRTIACEGILDESTILLKFKVPGDYECQVSEFCCNRYQNCEIYRMLMREKYEEEPDEAR